MLLHACEELATRRELAPEGTKFKYTGIYKGRLQVLRPGVA